MRKQRPKDCLCLAICSLPGRVVQRVGFLEIATNYCLSCSLFSPSQDLSRQFMLQTMAFGLVILAADIN